jgi:UDP-glucose:(heptosyl)LPS alpha-1,3-glucosyltransferase
VIAVTQQGKREMQEYYQVPEEKLVVIHNGVDPLRFNPSRRLNEGKKVRKELGIPDEHAVVLFVGTGFRRKGLDRLLRLWSNGGLAGIDLIVVGDDAKLPHYKSRWNQKEISFVGRRSNVEDYYAAADLLVLPSIQEAFGNVVLEALASGLPIITIPGVGVTDEIEGDLRIGILADPDDPEELKKKILWLLDGGRWKNLSGLAREFAEKYSWERYFAELEKQFLEVRRNKIAPVHQNWT